MAELEKYFLDKQLSLGGKGLLALVIYLSAQKRLNWSSLLDASCISNNELKSLQTELRNVGIDIWNLPSACDCSSRDARAITTILSFFISKESIHRLLRDIESKSSCYNTACAREPKYPESAEDVISAAADRSYLMSITEAANFLATYAVTDWVLKDGRKITNWLHLLDRWKLSQKPEQRSDAIAEWNERRAGRDPNALQRYEYYTDAQGRRWKRPFGDDSADWVEVFEYTTLDDGTVAIRGVL